MFKRILFIAILLAVGVAVALAAPITGKVQSTAADTLVINAQFDKETWIKEGARIKIEGGKGIIIAVSDSLVTVVTPEAKKLKPGAEVKFTKLKKAMTGC